MNKIRVFAEGATEKAVVDRLADRMLLPKKQLEVVDCGGQGSQPQLLRDNIDSFLKSQRDLPESVRGCLRILVLRDQDDGAIDSVVTSVQDVLRPYFPDVVLAPHPQHDRVFRSLDQPSLRAAVYVSGDAGINQYFPAVSKRTMDDCLLLLALGMETAKKMLDPSRQLGADRLIAKVTREIPDLLAQNGMTPFVASKDHLRFYSALLGISTSPASFARNVIAYADLPSLRSHFAGLLAAVDALSDPALGGAC
ncbi:MAG: hypothetical protein JNM83_22060 [Myxococcales bacterium]|nr:hypothetical protein [Myxococcales bacterium]